MSEAKKLAAGVTLRIPQERVDAQWTNIAARVPTVQHQHKVRAWGWLLASGVGAVCASLFWLSSLPTQREPAPQGWTRSVVRSDEDPVDFSLGERSRIALAPSSEMALLPAESDAISLELTMGSARLEVGDENGRALHVHSGPFELISKRGAVRVTRQMEETGERVRVEVEGGSVDVLRDGSAEPPVHLVAGEHWSAFAAYAKSERVHEVALDDERAKRFEAADEQRSTSSEASLDTTLDTTTEKRPRVRREQAAAATLLFERAHVARRAGQLREAADLYGEMVERFPRDKRAALAAFELGRIRMDVLNDPRGAVQALERSLVLDARRSFAEDALARLTLAHEALSDRNGCARARDSYLQRYPDGVHAQTVAKRCAP
jgi:TolA-binding protein